MGKDRKNGSGEEGGRKVTDGRGAAAEEGEGQHCRAVHSDATGQHPGSNRPESLRPGPHRQSKDQH